MKRALLTTAAIAAAVAVYTALSLPPRRLALQPTFADETVSGILHVHTNRSDGRSSPEEVAAAAARAGLRFVVFTDHGDATRPPDAPAYRSGVLCLDGVEISTTGGHYVVVGMPAAPYPFAGEARDVVEDVHRLGGFGIAAHPDSPKAELQWRDWSAPIDGIELLNPDSSWRVHAVQPGLGAKLRLARALLTYPVRPSETIASLLVKAASAMSQLDAIAARRRIVAIAGADAHAKLELRNVDPGDNRFSLPLPGYEASLAVLSVRIHPASPLTGEATSDADLLLQGLRNGHLYAAVDGWAAPPSFTFAASNANGSTEQGGELAAGSATTLHVRSNAPEGFTTTVWQGTTPLVERKEREFDVEVGAGPGIFRVEIRRPGAPNEPPWITSNPIFIRAAVPAPPGASRERRPPPSAPRESTSGTAGVLFDGRTLVGWNTETDPSSVAALDVARRVDGTEIRLRYGLSGGSNVGQFSGATVETLQGVAGFDRVAFTARAEHPMRISVQVRAAVPGARPERWQRSVYLDTEDRNLAVAFDDMMPVGRTHAERVPREGVQNIMFVVDTTNTKPGASGRVWIRSPRLER